MRSIAEIEIETAKVNTEKHNAERKRAKCIERLIELENELNEVEASRKGKEQ